MFGKRYTLEGLVIALMGIVLTLSVGGVVAVTSAPVSEDPLAEFVGGQVIQYVFIGLLIPALGLLNKTITSTREYKRFNMKWLYTILGPIMILIGLFSAQIGTILAINLTGSLATEPLSFNAVFELALLITTIGLYLFATGSIVSGLGITAVSLNHVIQQLRRIEDVYVWILTNPHVQVHRRVYQYRKAQEAGIYESYLDVLSRGLEATDLQTD